MRSSTRFHPAKVRTAAGFLDQESGSVTIFAIVGFAMCMVIIGLVFDVGRVMAIHTEVSSFADRAAIAAAKELDGRTTSLTRAIQAVAGGSSAVGTGSRFSLSNDHSVSVRKLTFLSELASNDPAPNVASPILGDTVTATWTVGQPQPVPVGAFSLEEAARKSRFVLVDVTPEKEDYVLFPLLGLFAPNMDQSLTVEPQAMAGFQRSICNSPPIMMCNPQEAFNNDARFTFDRKQMIRARLRTGNVAMEPGDIKILQLAPGVPVQEAMGAINSKNACTGDRINVRQSGGGTGPITAGLNMRFDMYSGVAGSYRGNANYAPASNVQKGLRRQGPTCANPKSGDSTPLPRDNCFMPSRRPNEDLRDGVPANVAGTGCARYGGRAIAGAGVTSNLLRDYWDLNQDDDHPRPSNGQFNNFSRYDLYRFEVEQSFAPHSPDENGVPTCSNATTTENDLRDRRVFPVAIVNCLEHDTRGNADNIPVEAYAEVFLTEPAGNNLWWSAGPGDIFLEIIGRIRDDLPETVNRDFPELVR